MGKRYNHLSPEERAVIQISLQNGERPGAIARRLGRHRSSITRELARNASQPTAAYKAVEAGCGYRQRRQRCVRRRKLAEGTAMFQHIYTRLIHLQWSPQQIAARLRAMHPNDPSQWISHETIYAAIYAYPRGGLKQALIEALRQEKPTRGRRRTTAARGGFVPEELRIVHRPEAIAERKLPGHWEGDLIKGAFNRSAVGTLVERKTRFVVLVKVDGCTAAAVLKGFTRQMKKLPTFLRESLTYDRGSEMACHAELAKRLDIDIWFADPHAPWQRGSNENTNGLLRQYLPKGADLSMASQTYLNDIARLLNGRPRKTLGWLTPEEAMAKEMLDYSNHVALAS